MKVKKLNFFLRKFPFGERWKVEEKQWMKWRLRKMDPNS
jgi:hypothetical protein